MAAKKKTTKKIAKKITKKIATKTRTPTTRKPAKEKKRCQWVSANPLYIAYHDEEWGVPLRDERLLFEFLILEGAQAGLSWLTILQKRENYRKAFANFDPEKVARFNERKIQALLKDEGIVRNQAKIRAAVSNAGLYLDLLEEKGSFYEYSMDFMGGKPLVNKWKTMADVPATTPESDAFSKDLKKRGFKFVGSTIIYAHMQAAGMVNDHTTDCFRYKEVNALMKKTGKKPAPEPAKKSVKKRT